MKIEDKDIKEMKEDFKGYISGTGKTAHDLAQLYLSTAEKMPEEIPEIEIPAFGYRRFYS